MALTVYKIVKRGTGINNGLSQIVNENIYH